MAVLVLAIVIIWPNQKQIQGYRSILAVILFISGCALRVQPADPKITLCFLRLLVYIYIDLCVHTYHVRNNYITYIVAM